MENTYGIGIANRYELFYDQDDVTTDFETVITKKKKSKEPAQQTQTPSTPATAVQQKSAAEKENKQVKKPTLENGTGQPKATSEQQQRRGIKEQQNNSNKDNSTAQRKEGGFSNNSTRPAFNKTAGTVGANGENREERNNRRNREMNGTSDFEKPRTGAGGSAVGQRNANRRPFDGRKRERDRQSGSDKTGVKSVDKRDGAGAHNWGSHKQDIDDINKPPTDDENKEGGEEVVEESAAPAPVDEEPKEMTLDEWKAQRKLLQPQYNLRKAGEGEDNAQWDKMKRLDKKSGDGEVGRKDDSGIAKKDDGKKKKVLEIEFNFNDGRRGGLGRRTGPGTRGGPGSQPNRRPRPAREPREGDESHEVEPGTERPHRGGDRGEHRGGDRGEHRGGDRGEHRGGDRGDRGGDRGEHRGGDRGDRGGDRGDRGGERRPPRRPRFENTRRGDFQTDAPHAPKVDDERHFPSLG